MQIEGGNGTGRLEAAEAAREAARRAAAEAAKRAAEAARKAAAEAAAKRAAEAAKKAAEEAAKRHTGRLAETAKKMDMGKAPWEKTDKAAAAAATGVAALTGSAGYMAVKNINSAKKKAEDIQDTVAKLKAAAAGETDLDKVKGSGFLGGKTAEVFKKADGVMKVVGGVQSALNLRNSVGALRDGATRGEVIQVGRDVLGTVNGVEAVSKLAGKGSLLGKFNPVVAVAGASANIASRMDKIGSFENFKEMSTKDKIANIASMGSSVADIVGAVTPPPVKFAAMGVSAGLSLVQLGAENFDAIKGGVTAGAKAVGNAVGNVAESVDKAVDAGVDKAKEIGSKVLDIGKSVFGGL